MQFLVPLRCRPILQRINLVGEIRNFGDKSMASIAKKDLPVKPKKPGNAYIQFVKNIQQKLFSENPEYSGVEIMRTAGKIWRNSDDTVKAEYRNIARLENDKYREMLKLYHATITPEQKIELLRIKGRQLRKKELNEMKKTLEKLGKPKRPPTLYGLYVSEAGVGIVPNETNNMRMKRLSDGWKNLSDEQKDNYRARIKELSKIYQQELKEWESKMKQTLNLNIEDLDSEWKQNETSDDEDILEPVSDKKNKSKTATKSEKPKSKI